MEKRRTILIWLVVLFAIGGAIDVFFQNQRGDISNWRLLTAIPILVLTWAWIRADRYSEGLPMYSRGFTWILAFLAPLAFIYHAFKSRNAVNAVLLLLGAIGLVIIGSLAGGITAILAIGFMGQNL